MFVQGQAAFQSKPAESGTIAKASRITSGTLSKTTCYKKDGVVTVSGMLTNISASGNGNFFTIPTGFRPVSATYGYALLAYTSDTKPIPWVCEIDTSGNVKIAHSSATADTAYFFATYGVGIS